MKKGFTLSEVLITLGVIGVVAAITMPTLVKNYQKKVTLERLKTAYSTLQQAVKLSENDNGPVSDWEIPEGDMNAGGKIFAEKYLNPYLKHAKVGNSSNGRYQIYLSNGTIITVATIPTRHIISLNTDLNGLKEPNKHGKDKFNMIIIPDPKVIESHDGSMTKPGLYFIGQGLSDYELKQTQSLACYRANADYVGYYCGALILQNNWKFPNDYPW